MQVLMLVTVHLNSPGWLLESLGDLNLCIVADRGQQWSVWVLVQHFLLHFFLLLLSPWLLFFGLLRHLYHKGAVLEEILLKVHPVD